MIRKQNNYFDVQFVTNIKNTVCMTKYTSAHQKISYN